MITNPSSIQKFERELQQNEVLTLDQKFEILNGMYEIAIQFGHFRHSEDLSSSGTQIAISKVLLSSCSKPH